MSKHRYRSQSQMTCQNRAIGTKSRLRGKKVEDATRRHIAGLDAHTRVCTYDVLSSLILFSLHSLVFRTQLRRRDLPQTNHEKKREEKRAAVRETAEAAREGVLRRKNE